MRPKYVTRRDEEGGPLYSIWDSEKGDVATLVDGSQCIHLTFDAALDLTDELNENSRRK
jgi:hypothetical protein